MVRKQLGIMALAVMVVAFVAAARATDLTLSNSGFQTDAVADGEPSTTTPTDWNPAPGTTGTGVVWNPTSSSFLGANGNGSLPSPAAGSQCLWVTGEPNLYQLYGMLVSPIQANKVYTLTAALSVRLLIGISAILGSIWPVLPSRGTIWKWLLTRVLLASRIVLACFTISRRPSTPDRVVARVL